jgi:phosphomevalonate kinase
VESCLAGAEVRAERIPLPDALRLEVVATGESASTGPRVRRFLERAQGDGPSRTVLRAWTEGVTATVEAFCDACHRGDASGAVGAIRRAGSLQERLGALAGIRIFSPGLRRACGALDPGGGGAVKPSGAGGGDCAVALVDAARRDQLRATWRAAGLRPLEVEASLDGVRVGVVSEETDG